jgi:hypothetical protein
MRYRTKTYGRKRRSVKKTHKRKAYGTKKYKTVRHYLVGKKYSCKKGGGTAPSAGSVKLPMLIDKNNVAYSCAPIANS